MVDQLHCLLKNTEYNDDELEEKIEKMKLKIFRIFICCHHGKNWINRRFYTISTKGKQTIKKDKQIYKILDLL